MWECVNPTVVKVISYLVIWLPVFFTVIGTFGNPITVAALLRMKGPLQSTGILLISLAISDTCHLYTGGLYYSMQILFPDSVACYLSPVSCDMLSFAALVSSTFSSWLLVFISVERVISVRWPLRAATICTRRNTIIAIVVAFVIDCIFYLPFKLIQRTRDLQQFYFKGAACLTFFIPFIVLTIANCLIIHSLVKLRTNMAVMAGSRRARNLRRSCLLIAFVTVQFLMFLGPINVIFTLYGHLDETECNVEHLAIFYRLFLTLTYGNDACNFFSYVLSGGRFRKEVKRLLCCKVNPCKVAIQRQHLLPVRRTVNLEMERQTQTQTATVTESIQPNIAT